MNTRPNSTAREVELARLLEKSMAERQQVEAELREAKEHLESLVHERTAKLEQANQLLQAEIIERQCLEASIQAEKQRFNNLLERLSVYVILLSPDYHVLFANRYFRERFGEARGQRCYEYLFNRSEPCEVCETYNVLKTNTPHHWEWTGPDGRNYDINDYPFEDTDGSALIMEMGIDVTERVLAEAELGKHREHLEELVKERTRDLQAARLAALNLMEDAQQSQLQMELTNAELQRASEQLQVQNEELAYQREELESQNEELRTQQENLQRSETALLQNDVQLREYADRLETLNHELQDFTTIASHDLQEPLRKINAFGSRLLASAGPKLNENELDSIKRMQSASERMQSMIESLLTYSRVSTKARSQCRVNLSDIVADVLSDLEVRIELSKAKIEVGDLPVINADPLQMHQLFQNLIGNAMKFSRRGVPPVVKVYAVAGNPAVNGGSRRNTVTLCVEDNGIGFDPVHMEKLFLPFHRLVNRSDYEGTGIGLAICRKIVERHQGTITARSAPGEGATFIVTMPVTTA